MCFALCNRFAHYLTDLAQPAGEPLPVGAHASAQHGDAGSDGPGLGLVADVV